MKLLLAIIIIAIISIIGSKISFQSRRLPLGFRTLLLTGTIYILIGVLLGKMGLKLFDPKTLKQLDPLLIFCLGWIGFLFGLQFEIRQLRNLPRSFFQITAIQALITFILVAASMAVIVYYCYDPPVNVLFMAALTLGSAACCTAQSSLAIVNQNFKIKNRKLLDLLRYISSVDGLFALLLFSLALCIIPRGELSSFSIINSLKWLFISLAMGVLPALIMIYLGNTRFNQQEYLVFLIGTIMFCGGLAFKIHHSPIISGLICGIFIANFSQHRARALATVIQAEKSVYIFLLLILGAGWQFHLDQGLIIAGLYLFIRIAGKFLGTYSATKIYKPIFHVPATLGLGLISEGGLAIAIIINFRFLYPPLSDTLITIIIMSILFSDLIAHRFIISQFDDVEPVPVEIKNKNHGA